MKIVRRSGRALRLTDAELDMLPGRLVRLHERERHLKLLVDGRQNNRIIGAWLGANEFGGHDILQVKPSPSRKSAEKALLEKLRIATLARSKKNKG